jgi:hypothetical protein
LYLDRLDEAAEALQRAAGRKAATSDFPYWRLTQIKAQAEAGEAAVAHEAGSSGCG